MLSQVEYGQSGKGDLGSEVEKQDEIGDPVHNHAEDAARRKATHEKQQRPQRWPRQRDDPCTCDRSSHVRKVKPHDRPEDMGLLHPFDRKPKKIGQTFGRDETVGQRNRHKPDRRKKQEHSV